MRVTYIMFIEKNMLVGQLKHLQSFEVCGICLRMKVIWNGEIQFINNSSKKV